MAKWKRVYVEGKGWRYTDGNSYRMSPPGPEQTVKAAVKGAGTAADKAGKGWQAAASKDGSSRKLRQTSNSQSDSGSIGLRGRRQREEENRQAKTRQSKPSALSGRTSSTNDMESLRRGQEQARQNQLNKANQKPAKVTDKPRAIPRSQAPAGSRSAPARTSTAKPSTPSKPMEKAYGDSGKDLYMASKKNNPLMQRTFGYQTGNAPGQQNANQQQPKPATAKPVTATQSSKGMSNSGVYENNSIKKDPKAIPFKTKESSNEKLKETKMPENIAKAIEERRKKRLSSNIG